MGYPCGVGPVGASSGHRSVSYRSSGQSVSAASISRNASSKLLATLCTNGFRHAFGIAAYRRATRSSGVHQNAVLSGVCRAAAALET